MLSRPEPDGHCDARPPALATLVMASAPMTVVPRLTGLAVDWGSFEPFVLVAALFLPIAGYAAWRRMTVVRSVVEVMLLPLLLTVPVLVLSYCAMRLNRPLTDAELASADAALRLDAAGMVRWADRRVVVAGLLGHAYSSFGFQLLLLPPLLVLLGRERRAYQMITGYFLICAISIAVSCAFPALGTFAGRQLSPEDFSGIDPHFGYHFLASFHAVRDDPSFLLTLGAASGIVTFPSIHAGIAVLCGWAAWSHRSTRWPFLMLNAAMFASAVTHGAHYAIDTLAGGAVALVSVAIVARMGARTIAWPVVFSGRGVPATEAGARSA